MTTSRRLSIATDGFRGGDAGGETVIVGNYELEIEAMPDVEVELSAVDVEIGLDTLEIEIETENQIDVEI